MAQDFGSRVLMESHHTLASRVRLPFALNQRRELVGAPSALSWGGAQGSEGVRETHSRVTAGASLVAHVSVPLHPQAGCENPSISLHVIGLNGPTHDLEMTPPDDPRMRFAPSLPPRCRE